MANLGPSDIKLYSNRLFAFVEIDKRTRAAIRKAAGNPSMEATSKDQAVQISSVS